eukprot:11957822-Karenia_brevis.AAC.1
MNTHFDKPEEKLSTYAEMGVKGPPYTRERYEMIDYILTINRWKNTIKDVESDHTHNIGTRHATVWARLEIELSQPKQVVERKSVQRYNQCTPAERAIYND